MVEAHVEVQVQVTKIALLHIIDKENHEKSI